MSQHYRIVNLTKREYIDPLDLLSGPSLSNIALPAESDHMGLPLAGLSLLLASSCQGYAGDFLVHDLYNWIPGRWCADSIVFAGDYDALGNSPGRGVYAQTEEVPTTMEEMAALAGGPRPYENISESVLGALLTDGMVGDMVLRHIGPTKYWALWHKVHRWMTDDQMYELRKSLAEHQDL